MVAVQLQTADPLSVQLSWSTTSTGPAPTGYLAVLQQREPAGWRTVWATDVSTPMAVSLTWAVGTGTYRAEVIAVDDTGRSAPTASATLSVPAAG